MLIISLPFFYFYPSWVWIHFYFLSRQFLDPVCSIFQWSCVESWIFLLGNLSFVCLSIHDLVSTLFNFVWGRDYYWLCCHWYTLVVEGGWHKPVIQQIWIIWKVPSFDLTHVAFVCLFNNVRRFLFRNLCHRNNVYYGLRFFSHAVSMCMYVASLHFNCKCVALFYWDQRSPPFAPSSPAVLSSLCNFVLCTFFGIIKILMLYFVSFSVWDVHLIFPEHHITLANITTCHPYHQ